MVMGADPVSAVGAGENGAVSDSVVRAVRVARVLDADFLAAVRVFLGRQKWDCLHILSRGPSGVWHWRSRPHSLVSRRSRTYSKRRILWLFCKAIYVGITGHEYTVVTRRVKLRTLVVVHCRIRLSVDSGVRAEWPERNVDSLGFCVMLSGDIDIAWMVIRPDVG